MYSRVRGRGAGGEVAVRGLQTLANNPLFAIYLASPTTFRLAQNIRRQLAVCEKVLVRRGCIIDGPTRQAQYRYTTRNQIFGMWGQYFEAIFSFCGHRGPHICSPRCFSSKGSELWGVPRFTVGTRTLLHIRRKRFLSPRAFLFLVNVS